jgi:hypothetical protein
VQLLVSSEIISPVAVGFLCPAVMIPETLLNEFSSDDLDHVFLHELAHIARRDDWTNLFARFIGALLPVHPVAVWVLKRIEQDREIACDDWVVAMTGDARPYAASLTRLFELCSARRRQLLATGMADRASHLGERVAGRRGVRHSSSRWVCTYRVTSPALGCLRAGEACCTPTSCGLAASSRAGSSGRADPACAADSSRGRSRAARIAIGRATGFS